MEEMLSESEEQQQRLVSSLLENTVGQTARQFLQATSSNVEEAVRLFNAGNQNPQNLQDQVRTPDAMSTADAAHEPSSSIMGQNQGISSPPFHLVFNGSFEQVKSAASSQDKWLIVNLRSAKESRSHTINRDTWTNVAGSQTFDSNFIFWEVDDDAPEGRTVCTYYKLSSSPAVLVINPTTGQKMRLWWGLIDPETLLEDLVPFMVHGPRDYHASSLSRKRRRCTSLTSSHSNNYVEDEELRWTVAASLEKMKIAALSEKEPISPSNFMSNFPPLPEEPKCDRSALCKIRVRFPDGRRLPRNFIKTESIQLLWSFCYSQLEEPDRKPFNLKLVIPGASKTLDYNSNQTFEQSGIENSLISVTWE